MDPNQPLTTTAVITHVITDMANAISSRPGESGQQSFLRAQVATYLILGLGPRDVIEAMLAGQTVMFHALMTDTIHDTLQTEADPFRHATSANIVAMNRAFHQNLDRLKQYQTRPSEAMADDEPAAEGPDPQPEPATTTPSPPTGPIAMTDARTTPNPPRTPSSIVLRGVNSATDEYRGSVPPGLVLLRRR